MVAFSFFAVALFCSLVKSGTSWNDTMSAVDTAKWLCDNYQYANEREFTKEKVDDSVVYYCTLTFYTKSVGGEEAQKFCKYHYPAVLKSAEVGKSNNLRCKYEIQYLCPAGKIPIGDLCIQFNETPLTVAQAKEKCEADGGYLPDTKFGREFVTQLINTANPRRLRKNVPKMWLLEEGKEYQVTLVRGLDSELPGSRTPAKPTDTASYSCVYYGQKTYRIYEEDCKIYKEQFKLTAAFHLGTCYVMSTSVYAKSKAHDLHQYCQWFSGDENVVTPVSGIRRDGIDKALEGTPFEYNRVLTSGEKKKNIGGGLKDHWNVIDINAKEIPIFEGVWVSERPTKDTDGIDNLQALMEPKPKREKGVGVLYDVPKYFRGHPVCALGVTAKDNEFKKCDDGWRPATRDDGRVMCAKAFTTELKGKTYQESMDFCKKFGAVLAPMSGPEEHQLIFKLMDDVKVESDGTLWLGAMRRKPTDRYDFVWELDQKRIAEWTANWGKNHYGESEPNNTGGKEHCLQVFTGGNHADRARGKWNDIGCDRVNDPGGYVIKGGVCAKYHDIE